MKKNECQFYDTPELHTKPSILTLMDCQQQARMDSYCKEIMLSATIPQRLRGDEFCRIISLMAALMSANEGDTSATTNITRCRPSKGRRCIPDVDL